MGEYEISSLPEAVKELLRARIVLEKAETQYKSELEAHPELQELKEQVREAKQVADRITQMVHHYALEIFDETGDKHPHKSVEIKEFDEVVFDKIEAFYWCIENVEGRSYLIFNEKAFRSAMIDYVLRPDFVKTAKVPHVNIDKEIDL